jgi:hypothetical protein
LPSRVLFPSSTRFDGSLLFAFIPLSHILLSTAARCKRPEPSVSALKSPNTFRVAGQALFPDLRLLIGLGEHFSDGKNHNLSFVGVVVAGDLNVRVA